ncbi:MAG TPA: hypothetical protein VFX81_05725 [Burkholderiaceae bacterium]|nr:hypothetical protein [Burkholderiaceae bacterium]
MPLTASSANFASLAPTVSTPRGRFGCRHGTDHFHAVDAADLASISAGFVDRK